jgi:hypothetical protein
LLLTGFGQNSAQELHEAHQNVCKAVAETLKGLNIRQRVPFLDPSPSAGIMPVQQARSGHRFSLLPGSPSLSPLATKPSLGYAAPLFASHYFPDQFAKPWQRPFPLYPLAWGPAIPLQHPLCTGGMTSGIALPEPILPWLLRHGDEAALSRPNVMEWERGGLRRGAAGIDTLGLQLPQLRL